MNRTYYARKCRALGFALATSLPLILTGCQDEDFGYSAKQIQYEKNFTDLYGEFPADKSWDLSSYTNYYDPEATSDQTRANWSGANVDLVEGQHFVTKDYWEVPTKTVDWMKRALLEGKDNRYLGSNFVLQLPANDFVIIPIYQGRSAINSELEVKINGYNIKKVWGRSENFLVNDKDMTDAQVAALPSNPTEAQIESTCATVTDKWHSIGYYNGWATIDDYSENKEYECATYPSFTDEAKRILTKPIYFRHNNIEVVDKGFMYLSLRNNDKMWDVYANPKFSQKWDASNKWTTIGHRLTSINPTGHMLALNVPGSASPQGAELPDIHEGSAKPSQVIMVACEDANGDGSDHDVNDVVFLIIGYPNAPTVVPTTEIISKRYMCEDLGGTYDFDFNDIVVDVTQERHFKIVATPSEIEDYTQENIHISDMQLDPEKPTVQFARIAHVCGTLPIQARVGNYFFPKIADPTNQYGTRVDLAKAGQLLNADDGAFNTRAVHENADMNVLTPDGWNPNETKIIADNSWNPAVNNVKIYVEWKESPNNDYDHISHSWNKPNGTDDRFADFSDGNFKVVNFPDNDDAGATDYKIPYIIAVNQDVPWMPEEVHIPTEWMNGNLSDRSTAAGPGSAFYMENYPDGDGEGFIWSGSLTGLAYSTGVAIKPESPEMLALEECYKGPWGNRRYVLLNVYTEPMNGQTGRIGLKTFDNNGDWVDLDSNLADGYSQMGTAHTAGRYKDTGKDVSGLECTTIYLTDAQWETILSKGLIVTSRTNGLVIRKITTSRPCVYTQDGKVEGGSSPVLDKGYTVNLSAATNGVIRANDSERVRNYPSEATDAQKATEDTRVSIPFASARYTRYGTVTLTAQGAPGYAFDYWTVNGSRSSITEAEHEFSYQDATGADGSKTLTVTASFVQALDPNLLFADGGTTKNITLVLGSGSTDINLSSNNKVVSTDVFDVNESIVTAATSLSSNQHKLTLTPVAVGTTSFIIYQKDAKDGSTHYGVSGELTVNVKVIELAECKIDLVPAMFYEWDQNANSNAVIIGEGNDCIKLNQVVNYTTNSNGDKYASTVLGNTYNDAKQYTDLNNTDVMLITTAADAQGAPRLFFNKETDKSVEFEVSNSTYCTTITNNDGTKTYVIDLKKLRADKGISMLNAITNDYGNSSTNVTSIKVDKYSCPAAPAWEAKKAKIASATIPLDLNMYYLWDGVGADATTTNATGGAEVWKKNEQISGEYKIVFGNDQGVYTNTYVDLSEADVLIAYVSDGIPQFNFNRQSYTSGGEGEQFSGTNTTYCTKIGNTYIVDLKKIREKDGFCHLNAVSTGWGSNSTVTVTGLYVDGYMSPEVKALTANTWCNEPKNDEHGWNVMKNAEVSTVYGINSEVETSGLYDNLYAPVKYLKVVVDGDYAAPRFFFNYEDKTGKDGEILTVSSPYVLQATINGKNVYYVDVAKYRTDKGKAYLNSIKSSAYNTVIKVSEVSLGIPN